MRIVSFVLAAFLAAGCTGDSAVETEKDAPVAKETNPVAKEAELAPPVPEEPVPTPLPENAPAVFTNPALATETAPESYTCRFDTSQGQFAIRVTRAWSPQGADRFYNLCKIGYYDGARFFRNIAGFMVQFGISAYPAATKVWQEATIPDDPVVKSNTPLMVTFAKTGRPNSRSTQVFINHGNNQNLDSMGFSPFGEVVEGADVVKRLYSGYGEGAPQGRGPNQMTLVQFGEVYLADMFPKLDTIKHTTVE